MKDTLPFVLLLVIAGCQQQTDKALESCLPEGWYLNTPFCENPKDLDFNGRRKSVTIGQRLKEPGAYCRNKIIYDRNGKKVVFLQMHEWHHAPWLGEESKKYHESLERKNREDWLELQKNNTVIRMWQLQVPS
jgi:hypothetical protein